MEILTKIQNYLKVPKGNYNSFGKYKYRSSEDILEAVKPLLLEHKAFLYITDSIELLGNKFFIKATASIIVGDKKVEVNGFAELTDHKGMSAEQASGTASSYARKYALNGLFLIDETEADPDHNNKQEKAKPAITEKQLIAIIERIKKGEIELKEKARESFTLTEIQLKKIQES